ncbi:hypothetical protein DFH06DRAFT_1294465 [Mycena polygramma]|nr:hypothetical protein DFH06DRAFT_1294465 [Mycena polygramma]
MDAILISSLNLELKSDPEPSRRLEILHALGSLICLPSNQANIPLSLQVLVDDLEFQPPGYFCLGNQTLQAVAMVSLNFDSIHGPRLINDLLNAWPKLFDWIWNHASPPLDIPPKLDPALSELKARYISATIAVFSLYTSHPALFHMSAENKDTPTSLLVARLWYWKVKGIDASIPSSIIPLCRAFLNTNHSTPDTRCVTLGFAASIPSITTCTWSPDEVDFPDLTHAISSTIRLLLHTPDAELTAPSPNFNLVEAHLGMIVALSRAPRLAFMNHHSSTTATKTLLTLSNLSASPSDTAIIAKCISLCVEHLCIVLEAAADLNPILEALDAMLLPILVKCYAHSPQLNTIAATKHNTASLLSTVLSKHLIFISVRERVSNSLAIIAATGSEGLLVPMSPFTVAWSNFKALTIQRMQIQERPIHLKNEIICSNIMCRKSKTKTKLQCCGRCHVSFYCSKACQTYDWKHGDHKKSCNDISPDRKTFPIENRDLRSVDEVVRQDLKLKLRDIHAVWETHRRGAPAPVVLLDYTTHPPGFVTMTADARRMPHKQSTPRQALFWRETVEMADAARKRGVDQGIIEIYITAGSTPYSTSVPITLNELERTIESAGPLFGPSLCSDPL